MINIKFKDKSAPTRPIIPTASAKDIKITPIVEQNPGPPFTFQSNLEGALWWFKFGYRVIPLISGEKRPAVKFYPWLADLDAAAIREHWKAHPEDEVGAVLDETQLVLDADTEQAADALTALERNMGVTARLVIKTRRGVHHHHRLSAGAFAKTDSHDTSKFPGRLDVRADRSSVLLTPSCDKSILRLDATHRDGLESVGQEFIDSVFQHNGRPAPRLNLTNIEDDPAESTTDTTTLALLLTHIDPDCGYQDWVNVLMAIYHETGGSEVGFNLANQWSKRGHSYAGQSDLRTKWKSFRTDVGNPITVATLVARAKAEGADVSAIMHEDFSPCETAVVQPPVPKPTVKQSPLAKYSLIGQGAKYADLALAATPLLGEVCFRGEATVWYAKHNTGKTLLFLHMGTSNNAVSGRR